MKHVLALFFSAALIGLIAVGGGYFYIESQANQPGPHPVETRVFIAPGSGVTTIADTLVRSGVVSDAFVFRLWARASDQHRRLRAGEFAVPAQASIDDVLKLLVSGKTVARKLTLPEGLTVTEAMILIQDAEGLQGPLTAIPDEGWLLPETYHYSWGDERVDMVLNMSAAMEDAVRAAWKKRPKDFILKSSQELLTLASIVEKETGVAAERPMVAAVFLNRLKKGMRLQSDPTVVYALTEGSGPLGRALTRDDLKIDSPYNTYLVTGLPPGPIALAGKASLDAVVQPADTDALYFVADGTGGHVFAKTLDEHNQNVAKWRKIKRAQNGDAVAH
jgi:UPF0755 protein